MLSTVLPSRISVHDFPAKRPRVQAHPSTAILRAAFKRFDSSDETGLGADFPRIDCTKSLPEGGADEHEHNSRLLVLPVGRGFEKVSLEHARG